MISARSYGGYVVLNAVIAASASQSDEVNIGDHINSMAFEIPDAWTTANLTFLGSHTSDGTYRSIYGDTGTEISVVVGATNEMLAVDSTKLTALKAFRYLKIRSGTKASPVIQAAERTIYVMVK